MGPLVLLLLSAFAFFRCSTEPDILQKRQLYNLHGKIHILHDLLAKECPGYLQGKAGIADQQNRFENLAFEVQQLEHKLLECQRLKIKALAITSTTTQKTTPTPSTTPTTTPTPSTTPTTTPTPTCPSYEGDSVFDIQLFSYYNPTNTKASGVLCNPDGSPCTIYLRICVSPIYASSCEFYYQLTDVVGDQSMISIPYHLGKVTNPLRVNLGNRNWQGVNIRITALQGNPAKSLRGYHVVDEFSYYLTDAQGSRPRLLTLHGDRFNDKTELVVMFTVPCPPPSITTAITTTIPITISPPVPAECLTAANLAQSWRFDHSGRGRKGGGLQAYDSYACDFRPDMGWFRFTGAAGTHMLDTCPTWKGCGTLYPYWTDSALPQTVGVTSNILGYGVAGSHCRFYRRHMQVMRCSLNTAHDVIYRYVDKIYIGKTCAEAFCGMN